MELKRGPSSCQKEKKVSKKCNPKKSKSKNKSKSKGKSKKKGRKHKKKKNSAGEYFVRAEVHCVKITLYFVIIIIRVRKD